MKSNCYFFRNNLYSSLVWDIFTLLQSALEQTFIELNHLILFGRLDETLLKKGRV